MARIVFLSLVFPPDSVSTAQIMGELAEDLSRKGHVVEVITTTPHYNRDMEAESRQPRRTFWGKVLQRSDFKGVSVHHVIMPKKGASIFGRLLAWFGFHVLSTIAGLTVVSRADIYLVPSPPLTIGMSAWILGVLRRSPFIYNVQEIYPDYAVSLGTIRNKWIIRLLYRLESFVYLKAKMITVIAPHMAQQLYQKGVPTEKVHIIPNFVDIDDLQPLPKDNDFSREYGVHDKFVVSYAGNMGPGQDLDTFIDAAAILQDHPNIHFMMMGDGMLRSSLQRRVENLGLQNLSFLPYQPYSLVPQIYAASDLCLVPQGEGIASVAVPSKVYRIMACARPVIAATSHDSDLADLISEANCGITVAPGSSNQLANAILAASQDSAQLREMGISGRVHVTKHYSRQAISQRYHELISTLCSSRGTAE